MSMFKSNKSKKKSGKKGSWKKRNTMKIPKTVQDSIPYFAVYPNDGIIETTPGVFTKSYFLDDINYQIAQETEQEEMFIRYGELLNSFDASVKFQITINNKNINQEHFIKNTLIDEKGDKFDELRREYNDMLLKKMSEGRNNMVREKYLTVSIEADSVDDAIVVFARLDGEIAQNVKRIGSSNARDLTTVERLEILHDIYNLGTEGTFNEKVKRFGTDISGFSFKEMQKQGLTSKDCIGSQSLEFKKDYMVVGDKYARALYLTDLPSFLGDSILAELTNTSFNMLTTINYEPVQQQKAIKMIKNNIVNINSNLIDRQKRAAKAGYSVDLISPELKNVAEEANELLTDLTSKNQKMFYVSFVLVHFADDLEALNRDTELLQGTARKFVCNIKKLNYQQENGLTSALPLAYNMLSVKRVLTTESTAVFMPYLSQELSQKNGMYYGLNAVSRNLLLFDRRKQKNSNGFILGTPGSGKSFSAKREMLNVLLNTDDDVIVLDPEREYGEMATLLGGKVVKIAVGSKYHINPLDMDADYADEDDPITLKSDFMLSVCNTVIGGRSGLEASEKSIVDRCCRMVYKDFIKSGYDPDKIPTLLDFQKALEAQPEREAKYIATSFELYTRGSQNIFAYKTNVDNNGRFVVYDIKDIGANMKTLAMLIVLDSIWNRLIANRKKGRRTWLYIDEIYLLFTDETSAQFLKELWKRARKWGGVPTGITQNVEDLLMSDTARTMLSNCEFIQMLNQAPLDRKQLAELLNISNTQLSYITNADPGQGLIYIGNAIVPFVDKFPQNTKLYQAMTTKPDELREVKDGKQSKTDQAIAALKKIYGNNSMMIDRFVEVINK